MQAWLPRAPLGIPCFWAAGLRTKVILLCVRWYLDYKLSYRDLVRMMAERGIRVSHTTILRWVVH
jgi:transposase-like protein